MRIQWNDREFEFDIEEMTIGQAKVIKSHTGLTMLDLLEGMERLDPDALKALYWLMHSQSGVNINFDHSDFKPVRFMQALTAAAEESSEPADPKDEQ